MISQGEHPDGDGESQLIDKVILEYLRAESEGRAGERQQWLDRYPACAAELAEFLDDRERFNRMMIPVQLKRQFSAEGANGTHVYSPAVGADGAPTVEMRPEPPKLASTRYRPVRFH